MSPLDRGEAIVRAILSLGEPDLRAAQVAELLRTEDASVLAPALDVIAARAEQAEEDAREALVSIVDAINLEASRDPAQRLREEAVGQSLLALERLIRAPIRASVAPAAEPRMERVPDYGAGRPLTLGERKALARKPNRAMLERLIADPHPDVIRRLLANPKLTEMDVIRLAAKRPCAPEILAAIARSTTWIHRARVRMAILLNPDTPEELSIPISGLLMRQELRLVAEATHVPAAVRAVCLERLARRPPTRTADTGEA